MWESWPVLLAFGFPVTSPLLSLTVGRFRPQAAGKVAALMAGLSFLAVLAGWCAGGGRLEVPWVPEWGASFRLHLDALGACYALLATAIAGLVLTFSSSYLPHHLKKHERPRREESVFCSWMLGFMGSLVGLSLATDLLTIFLFWEMTTLCSYFLIAFDGDRRSKGAALTAVVVTGVMGLPLLLAATALLCAAGDLSLNSWEAQASAGGLPVFAVVLVALAALAKSAQFPFQFWLPRAMAAPTPVSAYLHSAALVAAGSLLLSRLATGLTLVPLIAQAVLALGLTSAILGGCLALVEQDLKRILAYSTIAQFGQAFALLGWGGEAAVPAMTFFVLAHGAMKAGLFMVAGAVDQATGVRTLDELGGLARKLPGLAAAAAFLAAGLAGLPGTLGFFKDEMLFKEAAGSASGWLAVLGPCFTLAYMTRFWSGTFLGAEVKVHERTSWLVVTPIALLAALVVAGGFFPGPLADLAGQAGPGGGLEPAYHMDLRPENLMVAAAYVLGIGLFLGRRKLSGWVSGWPARDIWESLLHGLGSLASRGRQAELRRLDSRVATVLAPAVILAVATLPLTLTAGNFVTGTVRTTDIPLVGAIVLTCTACIVTCACRDHLALSLTLSVTQVALVAVFVLLGAPDVALVAVALGTLSVVLFLGILGVFQSRPGEPTPRPWRPALAFLAGLVACAVVWATRSQPAWSRTLTRKVLESADEAHGRDAVTVVLTEFRGLDTLGETSVLAVALLGAFALLREPREPS